MSKEAKLRAYLRTGRPVTPLEALRMFGIFRLAARIHEMRSEGLPIMTERVHRAGAVVAQYRLISGKKQA